jgi:HPt (histidine-containing phosphotransfer) domain-containing protein
VGGNLKLLQELFAVFKADSARLISEIGQAVEKKDPARWQIPAHTLKGMLSFFDAPHAVDKAQRLESLGKQMVLLGATELFDGLVRDIRSLETDLSQLSA